MTVTRRLVLVFPGFEPMPVEAHCARFVREAKKVAPIYDMDLAVGTPRYGEEAVSIASFPVEARGTGWETSTDVVIYGLGDLNEAYAARDPVTRIASGLGALLDFIASGTFFRFVATSWRYSLFFLYPIVILLGAFLLAYALKRFLHGNWEFRWVVFAIVFAALLWFASARMHFLLMMDDWACARDIARRRRPEVEERIAAVAVDMRARLATSDAEEVVLAAHSFGAITAVLALASVIGSRTAVPGIGLLTVGSSLLKVALHPAAKALRAAVQTIASAPVTWIDGQSLTDPMNFYGSNPCRSLGITAGREPRILRVRFRNQLTEATYRAIKHDLFRVHRQFVYAVEKRSHYSFHAILCGPEPFAEVAARGGLARTWPVAPAAENASA